MYNRWLSEDPAGYRDGLNLYGAYMGVNGIDPLGLQGITPYDAGRYNAGECDGLRYTKVMLDHYARDEEMQVALKGFMRVVIEPYTVYHDTATNLISAATGNDCGTTFSYSYSQGGSIDQVVNIERAFKESGSSSFMSYVYAGNYAWKDMVGILNFDNAWQHERIKFDGNGRLAGVQDLSGWQSCFEVGVGVVKFAGTTATGMGVANTFKGIGPSMRSGYNGRKLLSEYRRFKAQGLRRNRRDI